jgi:hypothetical protein
VGNVSGFNPTNLCPGSYTATVTSPQGCSVQVPVTINFTAGPNLTVSNTQTVNMNIQDYNTITVQSGGYLSIITTGANTGTIGSMIVVQSGGRLKISANLRFLPQAMIRVQQGGRVYIEGGTLSALCPNTFWHGIEVLGTQNNTHDAVVTSMENFFTQDTDGNNGQGGLRIDKGAIIERAVIGVRLFTGNLNAFSQNATSSGGYIWANEMTFRNNTQDIVTSRLNAENQSRLSRVNFILDNASLNTTLTVRSRVSLNHTRGMRFEGCNWSNTNVNLLNGNFSNIFNMTGLSLFRSSCIVAEHVTPTVKYRNSFNGFIYGIRNWSQCPEDMVVEFSDFKCYRGIYAALWTENSTVRHCNFQNLNTAPSITVEIPPHFVNVNGVWSNFIQDATLNPVPTLPFDTLFHAVNSGPAYGLYLNASEYTVVEYNEFMIQSANNSNMRVGCYVNNCGGNLIRIHENTFRGNTYGLRSFNVNRNTGTTFQDGTVLSCNEFIGNLRHLEINANSNNLNAGINSNIFVNNSTSRSNIFPLNINSVFTTGSRISATNTGPHTFRTRLSEISNNQTAQMSGVTPILVQNANPECGSILYFPNRAQLLQNVLNKQVELANYKDDGQTDYFASQIAGININNLLYRYNELIDISPALSTENILEVLQKEQDIPRSMLISILVSNASSLKNGDVLLKLEELTEPLSNWEKDSIYSAMNIIDEKELLQIELNHALSDYRQQLFTDYLSVRKDSTIVSKDSIISALKEESYALNPSKSSLLKAMKNMDWVQLNISISDMLANLKEDTHEYKDLTLLSYLVEQAEMNGVSPDSLQEGYNGFAKDYIIPEYPLTYRMAIAIHDLFVSVQHHGDLHYDEMPRELRSAKPKRQNTESLVAFELFPNPTSEILQIETTDLNLLDCSYRCVDSFGRECRIEIVSRSERNTIINVQHLSNGHYVLELISPDHTSNKSFIVSR